MVKFNESCPGCDHDIHLHFKDVTGSVRCMFRTSGVSTRGVMGLSYSRLCDCVNFKSEQADHQREKNLAEDRRRDEVMKRMMKAIREALKKDKSSDKDKTE